MMKILTKKWNFFIAGTILALFFNIALYVLDTPVGFSKAYLMISEFCKETIYSRRVSELPFFDWQTGFLFGIMIGALIASFTSGDFKLVLKPEGGGTGVFNSILSPLSGILGGFLVMLGLQLAGDSFIGHWAAAIQLSTASWLFIIFAFTSAFIISTILVAFRGNRKEGGE